jgi:hypothetical protein
MLFCPNTKVVEQLNGGMPNYVVTDAHSIQNFCLSLVSIADFKVPSFSSAAHDRNCAPALPLASKEDLANL